MSDTLGFWYFSADEMNIIIQYLGTQYGIDEDSFTHWGDYYYLSESAIGFSENDWFDFFVEGHDYVDYEPNYAAWTQSQIPWVNP